MSNPDSVEVNIFHAHEPASIWATVILKNVQIIYVTKLWFWAQEFRKRENSRKIALNDFEGCFDRLKTAMHKHLCES